MDTKHMNGTSTPQVKSVSRNEFRETEFVLRTSYQIETSTQNYILYVGKKPGPDARKKFRYEAMESLRVHFPDLVKHYLGYDAWLRGRMHGKIAREVGRPKNSECPPELTDGARIYGKVIGRISALARNHIRADRAVEPSPQPVAVIAMLGTSDDQNKLRYLECAKSGIVPLDSTVHLLTGVSPSTIEHWRTQDTDYTWVRHDKFYETTPNPKVDLARLQELLRSLSPQDIEALTELLEQR